MRSSNMRGAREQRVRLRTVIRHQAEAGRVDLGQQFAGAPAKHEKADSLFLESAQIRRGGERQIQYPLPGRLPGLLFPELDKAQDLIGEPMPPRRSSISLTLALRESTQLPGAAPRTGRPYTGTMNREQFESKLLVK